jgi:tetratricopeptide (TPR) repeat protein
LRNLAHRRCRSRLLRYNFLANLAYWRGQLEAAEQWYRKALAVNEQVGNLPGTAQTYDQLGNVAYHRGQLEAAEQWYRKALAVNEQDLVRKAGR